jgi:hypothetical protein
MCCAQATEVGTSYRRPNRRRRPVIIRRRIVQRAARRRPRPFSEVVSGGALSPLKLFRQNWLLFPFSQIKHSNKGKSNVVALFVERFGRSLPTATGSLLSTKRIAKPVVSIMIVPGRSWLITVGRPTHRCRRHLLIVAPQQGYGEPGIISYAIRPFCPTSADGLQ